jgi:CBS domain containing-hemolysin-like protein
LAAEPNSQFNLDQATMNKPSRARTRWPVGSIVALCGTLVSTSARASLMSGETLDAAANVLAWIVLVLVPVVGIAVFWIVHILPEKIAEKKNHPQAKAIQTLCLLSLVFGGLLWPLAWLWAYTKPVLYKMAYGTDQGEHGAGAVVHGDDAEARPDKAEVKHEIARLRERLASLEAAVEQEARG